MAQRRRFRSGAAALVQTIFTDRRDGDLGRGVDAGLLDTRRSSVAPHPWTWLEQVHGNHVLVVDRPGGAAGSTGDAAVTRCPGAVLSVQVADCAPVLMFSGTAEGAVVGAAHAGWRGVLAGVLGSTVEAMRKLGAGQIDWLVGPCITAANYEFAEADLVELTDALGPEVRGCTTGGAPALDLRRAVHRAMTLADCPDPLEVSGICTTSASHWSHRGSGATGRQVGAIWWERS